MAAIEDSSKKQQSDLIRKIVEQLHGLSYFRKADIAGRLGLSLDVSFNTALWEATEFIRRDKGLVFVPSHGDPGAMKVADDGQKLRRGATFRRTAIRKSSRALDIVKSVDESGLTADQARAKGSLESKISAEVLYSKLESRKAAKKRPPGL